MNQLIYHSTSILKCLLLNASELRTSSKNNANTFKKPFWHSLNQGLLPCMTKYPPVVCLVILQVKVQLSVYAQFVVLGLVINISKSAHLV